MIRKYTEQLLLGLEYLHQNNIVHRDIKCANILVDNGGTVKLTDFGASKRLQTNSIYEGYELSKSLKGSPYWMAPEVASQKGHSYPADIWSLGCMIIEMITGQPPWSEFSSRSNEVIRLITTEKRVPKIPNCSHQL